MQEPEHHGDLPLRVPASPHSVAKEATYVRPHQITIKRVESKRRQQRPITPNAPSTTTPPGHHTTRSDSAFITLPSTRYDEQQVQRSQSVRHRITHVQDYSRPPSSVADQDFHLYLPTTAYKPKSAASSVSSLGATPEVDAERAERVIEPTTPKSYRRETAVVGAASPPKILATPLLANPAAAMSDAQHSRTQTPSPMTYGFVFPNRSQQSIAGSPAESNFRSMTPVPDPVQTLKTVAEQTEAMHERYAALKKERQRLSTSILEIINSKARGPDYTDFLLNEQLALVAIHSSSDICIAKLKSLNLQREDAIAALLNQVSRTRKDSGRESQPATSPIIMPLSRTASLNSGTDSVEASRPGSAQGLSIRAQIVRPASAARQRSFNGQDLQVNTTQDINTRRNPRSPVSSNSENMSENELSPVMAATLFPSNPIPCAQRAPHQARPNNPTVYNTPSQPRTPTGLGLFPRVPVQHVSSHRTQPSTSSSLSHPPITPQSATFNLPSDTEQNPNEDWHIDESSSDISEPSPARVEEVDMQRYLDMPQIMSTKYARTAQEERGDVIVGVGGVAMI